MLIDRSILCWQELGLAEFMLQMEMEFHGAPDAALLNRALELLLDAQPVLGCRLVKRPFRPYWRRLAQDERGQIFFTGDGREYERFRIETIDATAGPQVKAFLCAGADCGRLLLKVSHVVADAGGVKEAAADLADIYTRLEQDPDYAPDPNVKGDRGVMQLLKRVPLKKIPVIISDFLRGTWLNAVPAPTLTHPLPEGNHDHRPLAYVTRHIDAGRTSRLAAYGRERRATLNDMVVAAAFRALAAAAEWDGRASFSMQVTFDFRRWYLDSGRAGGICNLSAFEYPTPGRELGRDFDDTLGRISAFMRRRKERMPGFAIACVSMFLVALPYGILRKFYGAVTGMQIAAGNNPNPFTNMGPIIKENLHFGDIIPARAWLLIPPVYPPNFGFGMSGFNGTLTLSAGAPESIKNTAENFLDAILKELPR